MLIVNTEHLGEQKFDCIKVVMGTVVRSKHVGKDILASFRTIVGGEIAEYTEMLDESISIVTERMINEAKKLNADAIVNFRISSTAVMQGASELIAIGTAVKFID